MESGKVVVVTGASGTLGGSISARLMETGFQIVALVRQARKLQNHEKYLRVVECDLLETDSAIAAYRTVIAEFGAPFALVNNAALGTSSISLTQNQSEIESVLQVNLLAPILLSKLFSRQMLERREGRIVMISSIASEKSYRGLAVYSASKAGLEAYGRGLAREVGRYGITVNSVRPGFMASAMTAGLSDKQFESVARRNMIPEPLHPQSVASAVDFLLSEGAQQVTGQTIVVDGGASN